MSPTELAADESTVAPGFVSIIMPMLDASRFLSRSLPPLVEIVEHDTAVELILVDNGSRDGTPELARSLVHGRARILHAPARTVAGVRNAGAAVARGNFLAFIDADCVAQPGYVAGVRSAFERDSVAASGCIYDLPPDPSWVERAWHRLHARMSAGPRPYLNGGNLVVRRDAFEQVRGFDESLVTGEDADLGERIRRAGWEVWQSPSIRVCHLGNPVDVGGFFRKQVWHGLGPLQFDRPTLMALVHGVLLVLGAAGLVGGLLRRSPSLIVGGLLAVNAMPAVAVLFRAVQGGWHWPPLGGLPLYHLYLLARLQALRLLLLGRTTGHRA